MASYTNGTDSVDLPFGYSKALRYNLAVQMSPEYKDASPVVMNEARRSMALIKRTNAKDKPVMANTARRAVRSAGSGYAFGISP